MCISPSLFNLLLFEHMLNFTTHLQILLESVRLSFAAWVLPNTNPDSVIFNS